MLVYFIVFESEFSIFVYGVKINFNVWNMFIFMKNLVLLYVLIKYIWKIIVK